MSTSEEDAMLRVLEPFISGMVQRYLDDRLGNERANLHRQELRLGELIEEANALLTTAQTLIKLLGAASGVESVPQVEEMIRQRVDWNYQNVIQNAYAHLDTIFENYTFAREPREGDTDGADRTTDT